MQKPKRNWGAIGMSLFLAVIMIASIAGYVTDGSGGTTARYQGTKFTLAQDGWQATINKQLYTFSYLPQDVELITVPSALHRGLYQIAATSDENSTSAPEIAQSLYRLNVLTSRQGILFSPGFTTSTSYALPVITCENSTDFVPVLYYKDGEEHGIRQEGNCVIVESSTPYGFAQLTDRIAYALLGVMQ